jgi:hypothetical protein
MEGGRLKRLDLPSPGASRTSHPDARGPALAVLQLQPRRRPGTQSIVMTADELPLIPVARWAANRTPARFVALLEGTAPRDCEAMAAKPGRLLLRAGVRDFQRRAGLAARASKADVKTGLRDRARTTRDRGGRRPRSGTMCSAHHRFGGGGVGVPPSAAA